MLFEWKALGEHIGDVVLGRDPSDNKLAFLDEPQQVVNSNLNMAKCWREIHVVTENVEYILRVCKEQGWSSKREIHFLQGIPSAEKLTGPFRTGTVFSLTGREGLGRVTFRT